MSFAALSQPVAKYTWEVQSTLSRTSEETRRIPIKWQRPVKIVGMYPTVIAGTSVGGGLLIPTVNDILVVLNANQKDRYTNRLEDVASTGLGESYVTLGSLSTSQAAGNRMLEIELNVPAPQLDVAFRWKRPPTGGVALYEDAIVGLCLFCNYV